MAARSLPIGWTSLLSNYAYDPAYHLQLVDEKLVRIITGETKRLMLVMPPRHGKTLSVTRGFAGFYVGKFPRDEVTIATYNENFSRSHSSFVLQSLRAHGPRVWGWFPDANQSVAEWRTPFGGVLRAVGINGPITGKGNKLLIIDDPVKDDKEANSPTYRARHIEWYRATASTRFEPDAAVILVMTRWNAGDLAGYMIEEMAAGGDRWEVLNLPALCEDPRTDPLGRAEGEALWPGRWPREELLKIKRRVHAYWWAALYQGRPAPLEGGVFQRSWWRYYDEPPESFDQVVQSWDLTFKELGSSYVVGQVWGRKGPAFYLLDEWRGRPDFPGTLAAMRRMTERWPRASAKYVEEAANGAAVVAILKKEVSGVVSVPAHAKKVDRAMAISHLPESGSVYLPDRRRCPWVDDWLEEISVFPNGPNDDRVDAMSQALMKLVRSEARAIMPGALPQESIWRR